MKTQFYSLITDLANHSEDLVCRRVHSQNDYSAPEKIILKSSFKIWKENSGTNLAAHCLRYSTRKKVSKMSMPWSHSIRIHNSIIPSPQLVGLAAQCLCLGEDDMPRSIAAFRLPAQEKWLQWKSVQFFVCLPRLKTYREVRDSRVLDLRFMEISGIREKQHLIFINFNIMIDIWVILRCWGNSSMICQQNSDAL